MNNNNLVISKKMCSFAQNTELNNSFEVSGHA